MHARRPFRAIAHLGALFLAAAPAAAFQSVHVVNGGGPSALQNAIDAASEGDLVLVHGIDSYAAVTIAGKSLTIVGEPSQWAQVAGITITGLAIHQRAVVSGLRVVAPPIGTGPAPDCLRIADCAGSVRLQALHAEFETPNGNPGLRVTASSDVAIVDSRIRGSHGAQGPFSVGAQPGAGIHCTQSRVALYDTVLNGGFGLAGAGSCVGGAVVDPTEGAAGIVVDAGSSVLVNGGEVAGGRGGNGVPPRCGCLEGQNFFRPGTDGFRGGDAIANAPGSTVVAQDVFLRVGEGGDGWSAVDCGSGPMGATTNGPAGVITSNPITAIGGPALRLDAPTIARTGQPMSLAIRGTPNDVIFLARSFTSRWVPSFAAHGVLLTGPTGRRLPLFVMPPDGNLPFVLPAPALPPGAQTQSWFFQAFARDPSGALRVGAGAVTSVVDAAF